MVDDENARRTEVVCVALKAVDETLLVLLELGLKGLQPLRERVPPLQQCGEIDALADRRQQQRVLAFDARTQPLHVGLWRGRG